MKNVKDLRDSLIESFEGVKHENQPLNTAKQLANTAGRILGSVKLELEYNKSINVKKNIAFMEY
jgi:hypothetical protein